MPRPPPHPRTTQGDSREQPLRPRDRGPAGAVPQTAPGGHRGAAPDQRGDRHGDRAPADRQGDRERAGRGHRDRVPHRRVPPHGPEGAVRGAAHHHPPGPRQRTGGGGGGQLAGPARRGQDHRSAGGPGRRHGAAGRGAGHAPRGARLHRRGASGRTTRGHPVTPDGAPHHHGISGGTHG
ncbi:hypothetical protein SGPA1_21072 [Streptomyces misionensis JCM 4497]